MDKLASTWITLVAGLTMIIVGNAFQCEILKIDVDSVIVNLGALVSFIWVAQFIFDTAARDKLLQKIREDTLGNIAIARCGICEFSANSHRADLAEKIQNSNRMIIGVNHSARIIANNMDALEKRIQDNLPIEIFMTEPGSEAAKFIESFQNNTDISVSLKKMNAIIKDLDKKGELIKIATVNSVFKYSFILFDDYVWVIIGTNSSGRKSVPGFMIKKGSSWFDHFENDIKGLQNAHL